MLDVNNSPSLGYEIIKEDKMKDYNPDTINNLIGAKVASYRSLAPKAKPAEGDQTVVIKAIPEVKQEASKSETSTSDAAIKKDGVIKEDTHLNTPKLDGTIEDIIDSKSKRVEDAYSFWDNSEDDTYAEESKQIGPSVSTEAAESLAKLTKGPLKQRFYETKGMHSKRKGKFYGKIRRNILGEIAAQGAKLHGVDSEAARAVAKTVDSLAAPVIKKGASTLKSLITGK